MATLSIFVFQTKATAVGVQEGCICHTKLFKGKNLHPVVESCTNCHQLVTAPHPQKGKKGWKLIEETQPELCAMCHSMFGKKSHVHSPVKGGMCTSCHNPHSADEAKLLVQPAKDLCLMCHPDKVDFTYLHGPTSAGDCTMCHNPHESDHKALAIKDGTELCLTCHFEMQEEMKKKNVHPALLGGCTSCHNPHGAPYKKLLSAQGKDLCFQCHPRIEEKVKKAKMVHAPINTEKACASCHSPHASDGENLLPESGKNLCISCHKNVIRKDMTVLHGPIETGTCTPCHDPHGSQEARLLSKKHPADLYVPYTDKEFDLCFSCHNRDLLRFPDTSFATGFRDGERNLHYLHVNMKKGRNCKLCHNMHGGTQPKLIADKAPFGKWDLPLKFVKTETGGSCSPGCHKTYNYDRNTPGKAPDKPKPEEKPKGKGRR